MRAFTGILAALSFCGILLAGGHGAGFVIIFLLAGVWPSYLVLFIAASLLIVVPGFLKFSGVNRCLCIAGYALLVVLCILVSFEGAGEHRGLSFMTAIPCFAFCLLGIVTNAFRVQFFD